MASSLADDPSEPVLEYQLSDDILDSDKRYYITTLDPRFETVDHIFRKLLYKRYSVVFKPIRIIPYKLSHMSTSTNYVLINQRLKREYHNPNCILIPEHEELNEEICSSPFMNSLFTRLGNREKLFVDCFTTSFFKSSWKNILPIGPKSELATEYDSKVRQRKLLDELDLSPSGIVAEGLEELKGFLHDEVSKKWFVSSEYSSGGAESSVITKLRDIERFSQKIRERNRNGKFVVSEYIDHDDSPNSTAIVLGKDNVFVASISDQLFLDQLMKGTKYVGNIFPSRTSEATKKLISDATRRVGLELARNGYRGFFGCDFLVKNERVFVVDINPRRQGGLLCNSLMFERLGRRGYPSLLELEMEAVLGDMVDSSSLERFENPQPGFFWSHSKIPPAANASEIRRDVIEGNEGWCFDRPGSRFVKSFFPVGSRFLGGSMIGTVLATGLAYDSLLGQVLSYASRLSGYICGTDLT